MSTAVAPTYANPLPGQTVGVPLSENAGTKNGRKRSWLEHTHPFYSANVAQWTYARDHYAGDVLLPSKITTYLTRRAVGESDPAYKERCAIADYTNHFAQVVEALAGMLVAVEGDANRTWNDEEKKGLGDPADPNSPIGKLWRRADQEGNGYLTVWKQLAIELLVCHFAWVMVDSVNGAPQIRVLPATGVPNWFDGADGPEVVVMEEVDARRSIRDEPKKSIQYLHCTVEGWQRYRIDEATGLEVALGGPNDVGTWTYESPEGRPDVPIFSVSLPMKRPVGYQLARKANAIFNQESARDNILRLANFPKLVLSADDTLFDRLVDDLSEGANALQEDNKEATGGHRYIAPPPESAQIATEVLAAKVKDFHQTAHREYGDAAAQKTATEVRQDVSAGTGAVLQLLKSGLDDGENNALWRVERVLFPADRRRWDVARVERSDDFLPADPDLVMERSAKVAFGAEKTIPLGKTAMVGVAKQIASYRGITVDEAELTAAVELRTIVDVLESAPLTGLMLPAEIRVDLTMKLLATAGLIDADAVVELEGGQQVKRLEHLRGQMMALASADDDAKRRAAETLVGGGTQPENQPTEGDD